ncbi:facilitated trehalose transporter Tret1-like [Anabrus simplex]|uniref:facilitated trehalose transporter Tret1-like n=1 Tax=Anabrus simplex TaxID=316456 RepID=UPI0035A308BD
MCETEAAVKKNPKQIRQFIAAIIANLNSVGYGFALGWAASALLLLQGPDSPIGVTLTSDEASWVASALHLGGFTATPIFTLIPDRIGRKNAGYITATFLITGWIIIIFANSATHLYIARFMCGLCAGCNLVVAPLYVVEIADTNIRGMLGSLYILHYNGAIAFAYILGAFISYHNMLYVGVSFPLIFLCLFFWLPETPKYLLRNGRLEEATKSLRWFRGDDHDVKGEIESIMESMKAIETSQTGSTAIKDIICSKAALRGFFILTVFAFNHQLSGITPVLNYTTEIFQEAGGAIPAEYCTIIVGSLQLTGNLAALFLVERAGRKVLLLISDSLMATSLLALGVYFYLKDTGVDISVVGWVPVLCLSCFVVSLSIGLGPLIYVVLTEIIPSPILWIAQKLCYCIVWFMAFIMTKYFYIIVDSLNMYGSFWLFAACCVLPIPVIIFLLPETKNKSLETIQLEMRGVETTEMAENSPKV